MNDEKLAGTTQINDVRNAMLAQLKRLSEPGANLEHEIQRSQAMASVGNVIVNTVKVELDYVRLTLQGKKNKELPPAAPALPETTQ